MSQQFEYRTLTVAKDSTFTPPSPDWELARVDDSAGDGFVRVTWKRPLVTESNQKPRPLFG